MSTFLSARNLQAGYGQIRILHDVSLDIAQGDCLAILGRNGMGKTTTIRALCGMIQPQAGQVIFKDKHITRWPSHRIARLGMGLVPEGRRCFRSMNVIENLRVAARPGYWDLARITALFPVLEERRTQSSGLLSGGEQQMLAIARALMTNPSLLLLDEATEGLAPVIRQSIWQALLQVREETGLSMLVIDKSIREMSRIASHAVILERGRQVWDGRFPDLNEQLIERYLGV